MKYLLLVSLFCALLLPGCTDDNPDIGGNEGIYINEIYSGSGDDWIELYNSTSASKNLTGYRISDDPDEAYTLPASAIIPPKGYLILTCDGTGTGLNTNFKLSGDGETLYLSNKKKVVIDKVVFPALKSGQSYGRYPDGSLLLAISGNATKGTANGDTQAAPIATTTRSPIVVGLGEAVTISVTLGENFGVSQVNLYYRFNSTPYTKVTMVKNQLIYLAEIPAQATTGLMEYYIEAISTNSKVSVAPFGAPGNVYEYLLNTDPLPNLVVNEFMAFNSSCCPDLSSGFIEYDDWIEIYNPGGSPVDLGGLYVSDDKTNPFKYQIPTSNPALTTIQPGGFLVIWADNDPSDGPLHADFGLSSAGEDVGLFYKDGRTIDAYTYGPQSENQSTGRTTNGGLPWKTFTVPTQGTSNQ